MVPSGFADRQKVIVGTWLKLDLRADEQNAAQAARQTGPRHAQHVALVHIGVVIQHGDGDLVVLDRVAEFGLAIGASLTPCTVSVTDEYP